MIKLGPLLGEVSILVKETRLIKLFLSPQPPPPVPTHTPSLHLTRYIHILDTVKIINSKLKGNLEIKRG